MPASRVFTDNTNSKLKSLGIYQIAGGIIGLFFLGWTLLNEGTITGASLFFIFLAFALFGYSIYCGKLLLQYKRNGLIHSLVNQFLQLIGLSIGGFTYNYISGFFLSIKFSLTPSFDLGIGAGLSNLQITINENDKLLYGSFNLIALLLIIFIDVLRNDIKKKGYELEG